MAAYILAIGFLLFITSYVYASFYPSKLPKHIPRIPLWITIYDTFYGTSRVSFYNQYVRELAEKHGAVVIWHLGRWSLQITKPEYLMQMFREDTVFAKGGSYAKVPWGPLGQLFGINVIDATGQVWKQHRSIVLPAIKQQFDVAYMKKRSSELRARLWREHEMQDKTCKSGIDIDEHAQDWSLSICCKYLMGIDLERVPDIDHRLTRVLTDRKKDFMGEFLWFSQYYNGFPGYFRQLVEHFAWDRLNSARETREISEFHYRSNMKQLFLAGFEDVESVLLSAVVEMAKNPQIQSTLHDEMSSLVPATYNLEDLDRLPVLLAVILETLRLHPPFPSLTNRYTTQQTLLGGDINIPAGTWIGWNAYAVQTDARVWGSDALVFRPDRWGRDTASINAMFRTQQAKAVFIPFSSRSRTCLGVNFTLMQLKVVLYELFNELEWGIYCSDEVPILRQGPLVNPIHCKFTLKARKRNTVP
ncbi:hypothetical protein TrVFT333_001766 [Trichoderma virens FT-333]|nr:hypothetical protein TrVFT333_001766 [Trichoderma virens FT-333]